MDAKMRNTIIGAAVGGLAVAGLCFALTGGVMSSMKEQALGTMAAIEATDVAGSSDTNTSEPSSTKVSETDAKEGQSESAQSGASEESSASSAEVSDGTTSETTEGSDSSDAPDQVFGNDPDVTSQKQVTKGGDVYIVEWGDTLSHISAEQGRSVDEIADLNGIHDVNVIYAESALRIPSD